MFNMGKKNIFIVRTAACRWPMDCSSNAAENMQSSTPTSSTRRSLWTMPACSWSRTRHNSMCLSCQISTVKSQSSHTLILLQTTAHDDERKSHLVISLTHVKHLEHASAALPWASSSRVFHSTTQDSSAESYWTCRRHHQRSVCWPYRRTGSHTQWQHRYVSICATSFADLTF